MSLDNEAGVTKIDPLVVGVGASAGGLEALTTLVANADPNMPVAWVLVQHLSPDHRSFFPEILQRRTRLRVQHATHLQRLEGGTVYVIEPNTQIRIQDGHIESETFRRRPSVPASSIDRLFQSLAQQYGRRCAAIVLSGSGSDGTEGARFVREAGGLVLAETPESAAFDSMPRSVIRAGLADDVLPPEEMASAIATFAQERLSESPSEARSAAGLRRVVELASEQAGINFNMYKLDGLERRILRRMSRHGLSDPSAYERLLQSSPDEVDALGRELLVGVTSFFRDPEAFWALQEHLRKMVSEVARQTFRVWVCGVSTGEEAYTVAMILDDILADAGLGQRFKLFATDISEAAITIAARGTYSSAEVSSVPSHMLGRYFSQDDRGQYRVRSFLRESMLFSRHDATSEPPFSRLDLITCRNMLIYLRPAMQQAVMDRFDFGLHAGGLMMLGSGEAPHGDGWFPLDAKWRLFRCEGAGGRPISMPVLRRRPPVPSTVRMSELGALHRAVTRGHLPPHVVVDRNLSLRYRSGSLRELISLPEGPVSTDLRRMVSPTLGALMSTAVDRLSESADDTDLVYTDVRVDSRGEHVSFDLRARRAGAEETVESLHFVFFFEGLVEAAKEEARPAGVIHEDVRIRMENLEKELRKSEHRLQSTIEELESSNEELQATNEELLASNEELQSVNEELQSVNEELHSVNREHQAKIDQLTLARSELEELLHTIDVGVLRLDEALTVRRVNDTMTALSGVNKKDVGRPLSDLRAEIGEVSILAMCAEAVDQEGPIVRTSWLDRGSVVLRAKAVRAGGQVKGVIFTGADVSDLHAAAVAGTRVVSALQRLPLPLAVEDQDGVIVYLNDAFASYLGREARWLGRGRLDAMAADPGAVQEIRALVQSGVLFCGSVAITFGMDRVVAVPMVASTAPPGEGSPGVVWYLDVPVPLSQRSTPFGLFSGADGNLQLSPAASAMLSVDSPTATFTEVFAGQGDDAEHLAAQALERCLTERRRTGFDLGSPSTGVLRVALAPDREVEGGYTGAVWKPD